MNRGIRSNIRRKKWKGRAKAVGAFAAGAGAAILGRRYKVASRLMSSSVGKRAAGYARRAAGSRFGKKAKGLYTTSAGFAMRAKNRAGRAVSNFGLKRMGYSTLGSSR